MAGAFNLPFEKSPDGSIRAFVAGQWVQLQGPRKPAPPQGAFGEPEQEPQKQGQGAFSDIGSYAQSAAQGALQSVGSLPKGIDIARSGESGADPRQGPFYKAGEYIEGLAGEQDPATAGRFGNQVASGIGQFAGQAVTTLGAGLIGGPPAMLGASVAQGVAMGADQGLADALENGADIPTALKASGYGALLGSTEAVPILDLLKKADRVAGGFVRRTLARAVRGGTDEALQEGLSQIGQNLVASKLLGYDEARPLLEGAGQGAGVGGTVGFLAGLAIPGRQGAPAPGGPGPQDGPAPGDPGPQAGPAPPPPTPQPNGPLPSGGTPPVPQPRPRGAFDDIGAQAQASVAPLEQGDGWEPLYSPEDIDKVIGYRDLATGTIRTPEEHRAPIATPLSAFEPVVPTPQEIAARAQAPAPRGAFADLAPVIDALPQAPSLNAPGPPLNASGPSRTPRGAFADLTDAADPIDVAAKKRQRSEYDWNLSERFYSDPDPYDDLNNVISSGADVADIQAHGLGNTGGESIERQLGRLLTQGIDPIRPFYTADLGTSLDPTAMAAGVAAKTRSPYLLISRPGKDMKRDGFDAVVVNGSARAGIDDLRQAFPQTEFLTPDEIPAWKAEEQAAPRVPVENVQPISGPVDSRDNSQIDEARSIAGLDATAMPRDQRLAVEEVWKQLRLVETGRNPLGEPLSDTDIADQRRVLGIALDNARSQLRQPAAAAEPLQQAALEPKSQAPAAAPKAPKVSVIDKLRLDERWMVVDTASGEPLYETFSEKAAGVANRKSDQSAMPIREWREKVKAGELKGGVTPTSPEIATDGGLDEQPALSSAVSDAIAEVNAAGEQLAPESSSQNPPEQVPDIPQQNAPQTSTGLTLSLGSPVEVRRPGQETVRGTLRELSDAAATVDTPSGQVQVRRQFVAPVDRPQEIPQTVAAPEPTELNNALIGQTALTMEFNDRRTSKKRRNEIMREVAELRRRIAQLGGSQEDIERAQTGGQTFAEAYGGEPRPQTEPVQDSDRGLSTPLNPQPAKGQGTYVSRKVEGRSGDVISRWARARGVEGLVDPDDMHVTLAYSRKPFPAPVDSKPMRVSLNNPRIEKLGDEDALVLRFDSPELESRFQAMKQAGAEHDYPSFKPHITLSYKPGKTPTELNLKGLPKQVLFTGETAEPLDEDAGSSKPETETAAEQPDERQTDIARAIADAEELGPLNLQRLQMGVGRLTKAAESQGSWRDWYDRHKAVIARLFGDDAELFQSLLSATSQAASVPTNVSLALKSYRQLKSGQPFTGYLPAVIKNLDRIKADQALAGAKIGQYGKANEGDENAIAVDRHIAMLLFNTKTPNRAQIEQAKETIRKVARKLGWQPRQVQAALWAYNQVRLGKDPANVQSYDTLLEKRTDEIAALRSAFDDVGRAGTGVSGRSDAGQRVEEGAGRDQGEVRAQVTGPRTREGIKFEGLGTDGAGAPVVGVRLDRAGRSAGLDQIAKELQGELRRIAGDKLNVRAYDVISMQRGDQNLAMGGYQLGSVIGVAVLDGDGKLRSEGEIKATGRHEVMHFMRETGLIPASSWRVLEARAAKWRPAFGIDEKYAGLDPAALNEEAIAEAYAAWSNGELKTDAMVTPIMRRIKQVLAAIRDVLRRVLGMDRLPSVEEVFQAIEGGEYADRGDGTVDVNGVAVAGFRATMDPRGQITAYHGTPHSFDRFSMDKIGTGEGAQAFGHGLYFAENRGVAAGYQKNLAGLQSAPQTERVLIDGNPIKDFPGYSELPSLGRAGFLAEIQKSNGDGELVAAGLRKRKADKIANGGFGWTDEKAAQVYDPAIALAEKLGSGGQSRYQLVPEDEGSLYTVSIDVDPEDLLDWDAPLGKQSEKVRRAIDSLPGWARLRDDETGEALYRILAGTRNQKQATRKLLEIGIPGIRYLDGGSRDAGDGTRNIVMFDDSRIAITAKAQVLGAGSTMQPTSVRDNMDELERISYPALQAAFNRLGRTGAAGRIGQDLDRLRFLFQDRFLPVKRVEEAVERMQGAPLSEAQRPYLQEETYSGRVGERKFRLDEDFKKPILENLAKAGLTVDQADEYIYAKHAQERNAHIAEINPKIPDGGSGMTDEEAKNILRNAARGDRAKLVALERHSNLVRDMLNERLDTLEQSGLYAPEEIQAWRDQYQHYVPMRGKEADPDAELEDAIKPIVGRGFMGARSREKPATGRFTRAPDILATAFTMADEAIVRAEKQRVQQAFLNLVQTANDPDFAVVNPVQRKAVLRQVPIFETRKIIETDRATGRKSYKEKRVKVGSRPQVRYTQMPRAEREDTVFVRVAGKEYRIQVKDTSVLKALGAMGGSEMGAIIGAMAKVNGILSQLNTMWNPEFVITNAFADAQSGFGNMSKEKVAGLRRKVLSYYVPALRGARRYVATGRADNEWTRWAKEFREAGGATSFNQLTDAQTLRTTIEKELKAMSDFSRTGAARRFGRNAFAWISHANEGVDNAMRLGTYRALREAGYSPARAASAAKNLTVNFNRKGALGPQLNAFLMFYNASVQGTATLVSAMKSPAVRKIAGGIALAGLAQEVLLGMMPPPDDDEDKLGLTAYERIPEYIKSRNMIIPTGTDVGDYLAIRMPYGYNVFHNVGRLMAAYGRGARELDGRQVTLGQTMARMLTAFAEGMAPAGLSGTGALGPVPVPSVIEPVVETFTNRNYQDKPISPDRFPGDDKPDSQNYFNSVSPVSREAAQLLNQITGGTAYKAGLIDISPESIDHVFTSTIGAAGAFAWGAIQDTRRAVGEAIGANAEDPKLGVSDVPFVRKVLGNASPYQAKDATYRRIEEIETLQSELDGAITNKDRGAAKRIRSENAPLLGMVSEARKIRRELGEIRKKRIAILDGGGSVAAKRTSTDRLEKRERATMARFNTQYLRAMKRAETRQAA